MYPKKRLYLAISATLGLTGVLINPVLAQDSAADFEEELILEEVIVTGTRIISEDGFGRTSPVTVVGMDEINSLGYTRIEDFMNSLPQVQVANSSLDSNSASGTATLNLRGLGSKRNLVLINGRRMPPGGVFEYAPDVNQIPAHMIERVEVLTGGASATYGADAVAGVVNFIMRRVNGVEVSAGVSGYQHDNRNSYIRGLMDKAGYDYPTGNTGVDGKAYHVNIVIGGDFADGRGNATAYANWRKNDALLQGARDYSSCSLNGKGTACGGSPTAPVPNFFIAPLNEAGEYDWMLEKVLTLQPDSSLLEEYGWPPSNLYNYGPINYYMRPDERWSLGAFVDYEINPHAIAYLEIMGFNDSTDAQIAESGTFFAFFPLQLSNAYFPENFRRSLEEFWPGEEEFGVSIGKRNVEGGPRRNVLEHSNFRIVTGLKGALTDDWDYDVSYLYTQTESSTVFLNEFLGPKVAIAVDSRLCESDPQCIPYEVFTYHGVTEEAAASLTGTGISNAITTTRVVEGYVTGAFGWGLPAGNVMASAGLELRRVGLERVSDSVYAEGLLQGAGGKLESLKGGYSVNEIFIEANVPLLSDLSFARNMTLDLAYRWSDYSTSGANSTYRVGLDWQALDWLHVRTGFNHAVRAPNIVELYQDQQLSEFTAQDPCAGSTPSYSMEQCARTGVTAEQYGNIGPHPLGNDGWLNFLWGGNQELDPEGADTLTVGLVLDIGERMQVSFDYWDIKIDGVIDNMDPAAALDQCALYDRLCELVHRAPGGSLWRSDDGFLYGIEWNLGQRHARGIDVAWAWLPREHWRLDLIGTWYLEKETTTIANDPDTSRDCAGQVSTYIYGPSNWCFATPRWRHIATVSYDPESFWALTGRWRFFSKVNYDGDLDQIAADNLGAQSYLDLSAVFRFMDTHDLTLGVNNILDKEPPLVGSSLSGQKNSINSYDQLGRYLFANLTLRW